MSSQINFPNFGQKIIKQINIIKTFLKRKMLNSMLNIILRQYSLESFLVQYIACTYVQYRQYGYEIMSLIKLKFSICPRNSI